MNKRTNQLIYAIVVIVFLIMTLGPLLWSFIISITPGGEVMKMSTSFLPETPTLENYQQLLDPSSNAHETVFGGLRNSLISSAYTIIIGVPLAIVTGYTFVRFQFKFRQAMLRLLLITIVIPVFTTIIPIFAMFSEYGLLDQIFWISVIYVTAFLPLATWMMVNHFNSIPKEMWEAAQLDGCNEWEVFLHIIFPMSKSAVITSVLTLLLMSWSQFQIPMILTSSQDNKVVTLVLSEFMTRDAIDYSMIASAGLFTIVPPALIAIVFRKYLISGLSAGAVKG